MKKGGDNDGEIVADGLGFDGDVDEDVIIGLIEVDRGQCGDNATYVLYNNGLLEISGTGEISDSTHYRNAFEGRTDISSVVIHTGITIIGAQAFYECSNIASVDIPEGVTKIDTNALRGCIRMTSVTIPSTVTDVGYGAFCDWTFQSLLETVTVLAETPPVAWAQSDLFAGCMRLTAIYVPAASVDTYKAASGWSSYASVIQAIPSGD